MKKTITLLILIIVSSSLRAQLNADFTWCPVPDSSGQLCCIQFENLSTDTGGTIASYFYIFGDGQESTLMEPRHCYAAIGTYIVYLFVTDNMGNVDTAIHSLTITHLDTAGCNCDSLIGVNEIFNHDFSFSISPNPFHEKTIISLHSVGNKKLKNAEISIYNSLGALMRIEKIILDDRQEITFERKSLSQGVYYFSISSEGKLQAPPLIFIID